MSALGKLISIIEKNKSMVCVGLDLDPTRLPKSCGEGAKGLARFALSLIEATADIVAAYKPNLAFYEALGPDGLSLLKLICSRIPSDTVIILDAKRGDIGNSSEFYARACFDIYNADWVTVNPLMGHDSVKPFLARPEKGAFLLCLTSNPGSQDFQMLPAGGQPLYLVIAEKALSWTREGNCGLVVGATNPDQIGEIRRIARDMPILIPGIGAQGGDLEKAVLRGTDHFSQPAIINVARSVIYASSYDNFAAAARAEVEKLNGAVHALRTIPA
jgi:orotidine-5'-phosphate decarboxylase